MKKILLMGNPNVGKSVVFSRLTGVKVISSNYPGTTVELMQGYMPLGDEGATLIDVPGTYALEATCKAEEIAIKLLAEGDAVIDVIDATNLERNLHLTLHLLEQGVPLVVALNIWDDAKHKGIHIDVAKLEAALGVPVIPTVAVTGEGIRELFQRLPEAKGRAPFQRTIEERWGEVGRIVATAQSLEHRHHTFYEWLGDVSVQPVSGLVIAAAMLVLSFCAVRLIGETLIAVIFDPLFETAWRPVVEWLSGVLFPGSLVHEIVIGKLINGQVDFVQSFGALTTGLYVAVTMVFPYVLSFYAVLGFLEDFGYLPRLAVLLDTLMHRVGLHGWAIIPMFLGIGCNVPGIMATRVLESPRERWIASTLVSVAIPCAALQAMIWGLLGAHGLRYVLAVYGVLLCVWIVLGRILNKMLGGSSPELILEIPPYRMPSWQTMGKKLWLRMMGYFREAMPVVLVGVCVVQTLFHFGVFDAVTELTAPVVTRVFGLPKEAVVALVIGFFRKDVAVGMLGLLDLSVGQLIISVVVLAMSFPCIATFVVLLREVGLVGLCKSIGVMLIATLVTGGLLNILI